MQKIKNRKIFNKKMLSKKRVVYLSIFIGILMLFFWIRTCSGKVNIVYDYDSVSKGSVKKTISVSGKLGLYDEYTVRSVISGEIIHLEVDFNDKVKKGQLLAKLSSPSTDDAITSYLETYKGAKLDLESSREYLQSKRNLYNENLISKKDLETAQIRYKKSLSAFNLTKIKYGHLVEASRKKRVYSPISGMVMQRWADLRKSVTPGAPLFIIAPTLKKMKLVINIDESDIGIVKEGQTVDFYVSAYPEKTFGGAITQVRMNPIQRGSIVTYESLVICDNKDELLRPGMTATATVNIFETDRQNHVLRVPNQAFIVSPVDMEVKPGKKYIWIKTRVTLKKIPMKRYEVITGVIGDNYTEIKKVVNGKIKPGDKVLIGMHEALEVRDELSSYGN
jgi:HlyD family secretion protein